MARKKVTGAHAAAGALLLLLAAFASTGLNAQDIQPGETLTLEKAVELALKNQASLISKMQQVRASEARTGQARSGYLPQVDAVAGYARVQPVVGGGAVGLTTGQTGIAATKGVFEQYSSTVSLSQMLFDFGRVSSQVRIQDLNTQSARFDEKNTRDQIIYNVKQAYYAQLQAYETRKVAEEAVGQFRKTLDQANAFYSAGVKPKFDVTKAEVDLSTGQLVLIRADNQVKLARANLNDAMGLLGAPPYEVQGLPEAQRFTLPFEDAVRQAFAQRPDLLSLERQKDSAEESVSLAKKAYFPNLSGNANYSWYGTGFPLQDGWTLGLNVSVPIFNGFLTKYQVAEAAARKRGLRADEQTLKQAIYLQVQQGYLNLREAEERIVSTGVTVKQGKENLDIATGRYQAGVGNPIEVSDATVIYANAQAAYTNALYDYRIAAAAIERAIAAY